MMVEHTSTAADEQSQSDSGSMQHTSFEQLVAEPERVASEAASRPVRLDGPNGEALVLVDAGAFDRLRAGGPRAILASDLSIEDAERMLDAPVPDSCKDLNHLVPEGWLDEHERLLGSDR